MNKPHPAECPMCKGVGYTQHTATEFLPATKEQPYRTLKPGSGCPVCGGTGRLDNARPSRL